MKMIVIAILLYPVLGMALLECGNNRIQLRVHGSNAGPLTSKLTAAISSTDYKFLPWFHLKRSLLDATSIMKMVL